MLRPPARALPPHTPSPAAAVAGNVASFFGSAAPSLGASGAVFGLGGALGVYFYRNRAIFGRRSDLVGGCVPAPELAVPGCRRPPVRQRPPPLTPAPHPHRVRSPSQVLSQLWQTLLMNLMYGLMNPRIDNWCELWRGGAAGGA